MVIPIITAIVGCYLIAAPVVSDPTVEYLYVLVVLFIGFIIYIPFVYYKCSLVCIGKFPYFKIDLKCFQFLKKICIFRIGNANHSANPAGRTDSKTGVRLKL